MDEFATDFLDSIRPFMATLGRNLKSFTGKYSNDLQLVQPTSSLEHLIVESGDHQRIADYPKLYPNLKSIEIIDNITVAELESLTHLNVHNIRLHFNCLFEAETRTTQQINLYRTAFCAWIINKGSHLQKLELLQFHLKHFPGFWMELSCNCPNLRSINFIKINVEPAYPKEMYQALKRLKKLEEVNISCVKYSTHLSSSMERKLRSSLPKLKKYSISFIHHF